MCELFLRSGNLLKVVPLEATRLHCRKGHLLITIPSDLTDHQLEQGDELLLPRNESIVIEGDATFVLSDVLCQRWKWWSVRRLLSGFSKHGPLGDQLLRYADVARYRAKQTGGHRFWLYSKGLNDQNEEMQGLGHDLREGIKRDEILLHFQPQTVLGDGKLCGVEALARWRHPLFGILSPDHFIPLAEQCGLINQLTRKILDLALAQLNTWDLSGLDVPKIAVNISASDLRGDFCDVVEAALARHALLPHRLELEITESTLTADGIETMQILNHLRKLGISISVDDFGVGYSSLSQLHRLPIDCLKIDRCLIQDIQTSASDRAIVQAIVTLADTLGLRTVAEGIELETQIGILEQTGCLCGQGFFISKGLPGPEAEVWMRQFLAAGESA